MESFLMPVVYHVFADRLVIADQEKNVWGGFERKWESLDGVVRKSDTWRLKLNNLLSLCTL
jgi:hypothetical protein